MTAATTVILWDEIDSEPCQHDDIMLDKGWTTEEMVQAINHHLQVETNPDDDWHITGRVDVDSVTLITHRSDRGHLSTTQIIWDN